MNKPKLTMIEFFSGIGAQKRGIDNTDLYDLEVVATSDVDKEAVVEYAAIHHGLTNETIENYKDYPNREEMAKELKSRNIGMDFDKGKMFDWDKLIKKKTKDLEKYWLAMTLQNNLGDISKIEQAPYADCWFYSSPCQCFSVAGKQDGIDATCNECGQKYNPMELDVEHRYICPSCGSDDIKGTRSGLLLEIERLLIKAIETGTAPKYLCLENVKNLVGKQFKSDFDAWLKRLEHLGYNTYWEVLNAKTCGVPQNRERVFAMSIRKDIDTGKFTFPLPFDTGIRLKDILEKNVDEKYYISNDRANNLILQLIEKGQLKKPISVNSQIEEEWKDIKGYDGLYQISNIGNVRSLDRIVPNSDCRIKDENKKTKTLKGKTLSLLESKVGYYVVNLSKDGGTKVHYVHRLVAQHFLDIIEDKTCVNHIDGNKHNNVFTNLEWVTTEENMYHAWETGLCHSSPLTGGIKAVAKLDKNTEEVIDIYISIAEATRINNYKSASGISMVLSGEKKTAHGYKWAYVDTLINNGVLSKDDKDKLFQPILVKNQATEYTRTVDTANTLMARDWKGFGNQDMVAIVESEKIDDQKRLGGLWDGETRHQAGSVWDSNGMSPTLDTCAGGGRQPHIIEEENNNIVISVKPSSKARVFDFDECKPICVEEQSKQNEIKYETEVIGIKQATKKGYIECELPDYADLSYPTSTTRRGRVQDNGQTSPTITATETGVHYIESVYRIRKLTVRECFKLMSFEFEDWDKCSAIGISNSAGYKAAGNSICCCCISLLFEHLYKAQYDESYICTDEKMQNFQKPEVE